MRQVANKAFTLIEMLIVLAILLVLVAVLIVAVMFFKDWGNESATKDTMEAIGAQLTPTSTEFLTLTKLEKLRSYTTPQFQKATGIDKTTNLEKLDAMQRSKILAFLIAPTKEQWDKIVPREKNLAYRAPISEDRSKAYVLADKDGFNFITDAWDKPITFEIIPGIGADPTPKWVLRSGGKDEKFEEIEDNWNYSMDNKAGYQGAWKK